MVWEEVCLWKSRVPELECRVGWWPALGFGRLGGLGLLSWPSDLQLLRWTKVPRPEAPAPCSSETKGGGSAEGWVVPDRLPHVLMAVAHLAEGGCPPRKFQCVQAEMWLGQWSCVSSSDSDICARLPSVQVGIALSGWVSPCSAQPLPWLPACAALFGPYCLVFLSLLGPKLGIGAACQFRHHTQVEKGALQERRTSQEENLK